MSNIGRFPESVLLVNQLPTAVNFDLYKASSEGNVTLVNSLLASGGKPNFINISDGQKTSLHIAAENGHAEIVGQFLRNGAEINCIVGTTKVITSSTLYDNNIITININIIIIIIRIIISISIIISIIIIIKISIPSTFYRQ